MKISIIIPIYNVAPYIEKCLDSIRLQTYKKDIECLLIDDCGTDNSVIICENYIYKYKLSSHIHIIHHLVNRGAGAARNTGIKHATGDFITFVDGDDWLEPNYVEELVQCYNMHTDSQLVQCGIKTTDGSIPWFNLELNPLPKYSTDRYQIKTQLLGRGLIPNSPCGKLMSLSFIRDNNLYFHEGIVFEDELWVNQLAKFVTSLSVVNKSLYVYLIHPGSVVTSGLGRDPYRQLIIYNIMIDNIDEPYVQEQVDYLLMWLNKIYFSNQDLNLRKQVGKLLFKLSSHCHGFKRIKLLLRSILTKYDHGNQSIAYYLFYKLSL